MDSGGSRRRRRLSQAAALFALPTLVALACDDREDRVPQRGSVAGSGASVQGGAEQVPTPNASGEAGALGIAQGATSSSGGAEATAGAAGDSGDEVCDEACLESVATQPSDFGTSWYSSWFLMGCKEKRAGDCLTTLPAPCSDDASVPFEDRGAITLETFPIGGLPGRHYKVTFTFNANASAKEYEGGARDQGAAVPADVHGALWDTFYRDGDPIPSNYDSWKLSVLDDAGVELRHYYMNAFPPGMGFESHRTFLLSYTKSIVVVGGGKVTHRVQDPNCLAIDNCRPPGPVEESCGLRYLPNEPMSLTLPAMYQDPQDGLVKPTTELSVLNPTLSQPWHSQLGHLTITAVEATDDPVTHDYP